MIRPVLVSVLALAACGCATFASNVEGDFSCRAPKGTCAPSHTIDAAATAGLASGDTTEAQARIRASLGSVVSGGDTARTAERTLRIVFPAHVDEWGTLHDEAIAWAVVETPRWAAELRRKPGEETAPPLMRQLKRQLKEAEHAKEAAAARTADKPSLVSPAPADEASSDPLGLDWTPPFSLVPPTASPLVLPSTAREAVAGAHTPAVEGFDMPPSPHDRTPRHGEESQSLAYPSAEAIEAARTRSASDVAPETGEAE